MMILFQREYYTYINAIKFHGRQPQAYVIVKCRKYRKEEVISTLIKKRKSFLFITYYLLVSCELSIKDDRFGWQLVKKAYLFEIVFSVTLSN